MPVFTLGLGGYHGPSCNVSFSAQRNTVLIDPCASITDTDIPSKYRRIAVNRPSEHLCCLPIRTPPKCFPSPWPDTPLEILRGHLPVPIQTWSLLWVLLLWALAKDQRGPRAQTPQFLQRIPEVFPPAKFFKPLRCVAGSTVPTDSPR